MNSFEKVIQGMFGGSDNLPQGENGWLHALLSYAASDYEDSDTHTNPCRETYRRLESRGVNPFVMYRVRQMLNTLEAKYDGR